MPRSSRCLALGLLAPLVFGCSVDPGSGLDLGNPYLPGGDAGGDESDGSGAADAGSGGSTGSLQGGSTSDAGDGESGLTGPMGSTSGPPPDPTDSGGSSDGTVADEQPAAGMYAHCLDGQDCGPGWGCLQDATPPTDGFCTSSCAGVGDPTGCDPAPGGTAVPACIVVSAMALCALECGGGKACPSGMVCLANNDDNGPIEVCF